MKIKILRTTVADGQRVEQGKTYDISEKNARYLISLRKAEQVPKPKKKAVK